MKNYLVIENDNLIEKEDLFLIGSSTKRGDDTKIGMFGSGWKFALAKLIREDITPFILSGKSEIKIDTDITLHRNNPIRVITVDGEKTSITSQMGHKWNLWMAIREIISNAIDEGNFNYNIIYLKENIDIESFKEENKSKIIIPFNKKLAEFLMSFDNYFDFERKEYYKNEVGKIFIKKEASETIFYRKGIRCYNSKNKCIFDFSFNNIDINEDRLTSEYLIKSEIFKFFSKEDIPFKVLDYVFDSENTEKVIDNFIKETSELDETNTSSILDLYYFNSLQYLNFNDNFKEYYSNKINEGYNIVPLSIRRFVGKMFLSGDKVCFCPNKIYSKLKDLGFIKKDLIKSGYPEGFTEIDEKNNYGVLNILSLFNFDKYTIKNAIWANKYSLIFIKDDIVYINDACDENNVTDIKIAYTIIRNIPFENFVNFVNLTNN